MSKGFIASLAGALAIAAGVSAQTAPQWGQVGSLLLSLNCPLTKVTDQCGGQGWTGPTTCPDGWVCTTSNQYYSQCLQGAATAAPSSGSTVASSPGSPTGTSTAPAGATPTLVSGFSFIRAVEDPNFHKYLRSEVIGTASDAVLGEPVDAAQFQIVSGQLQQSIAGGDWLYAVVEPRANSTVVKLKVSWSTTPATSGTFSWSGDTVEWNDPSISRPQSNAWLICPDAAGNKDLYVNLGPYDYNTPAGCADETIHAYTGATPTA
ncbi:hypothetical protein BDY19DRAFT_891163 [Irpex rosettiformis]|uniref:Uncharacterized protein n=1 Tax=Irpex rosettiformis TaxID=378272 RepID=A0ACB8U1R7_9APHY|nr:hypothetical protein BDY19DRAFT_891163 [Irpex rosettiformis]